MTRLTDDELEKMYRAPDSITSRQAVLAVSELRERRAADDTATVRALEESVKPFREDMKPQLDEAKDLMLAIEMVLREVGDDHVVWASFSDRTWPAEVRRVLKLVREFRSSLS